MIDGLKPYAEYKESGVAWLGNIPANWQIIRTKHLFRLCIEKAPINNSLELLSIYTHIGVKPRKELEQRGNKASSTDEYWIVKQGDIIVNKLLAWMGAIGVSHYDGVTSPAYDILRGIQPLNPDFYHYLFRTGIYLREFKGRSRGIMEMRLRLYFDKFGQIPLAYPPLTDQTAIVRFLDYYGRLVNQAIQSKRRLIEFLNEQKQAIIHKAVTRGLDPNVRLKPSGIEWLGDVPKHWEIKKLKYLCSTIVGGSTPSSSKSECWNGEIVWITPQDISKHDRLIDSTRKITADGLASCSTVLVPSGSIILTSRAPVGNVGLSEIELCTNQGCKALLPIPEYLDNEFAFLLLKIIKAELQSLATGTTFTEISTSKLSSVKMPLPPLPEQMKITNYVNVSTKTLNDAIEGTRREIDILSEYRTRLISDVVTGKLDVRGVELPAMDEAEIMGEIDIGEDTEMEAIIESEEVANAY